MNARAPQHVTSIIRGNLATLPARFATQVGPADPVTGCTEWNGYRTTGDYGEIDNARAHRVAYWLTTGVDPGTLYVLHSCDNPPCAFHGHLRLGTQAENTADMYARGRENNPVKVTDDEVVEIRHLYAAGWLQRQIADRFHVGQQSVSRICKGVSRASSPSPVPWRDLGYRTRNTVLSDVAVIEVRHQHAAGGVTQRALAARWGVGQPHISYIVRGLERGVVA